MSMNLDEQTRQEAAQWFSALRRGPMSLEERAAFDTWRSDPSHSQALNSMHEVWGELAGLGQLGVEAPRPRAWPRRAAVAGLLAVFVSAGLYWATPIAETEPPHRLVTAVGEQRTTTMPDGSVLSINVATRLAYEVDDRRRAVSLEDGEAAFFVRRDSSRPFIVSAAGYEVEAIGTAFNVRSRGGEVDVSVMEGVVSVRAADGRFAGQEIRRIEAGRRISLAPIAELGRATNIVSPVSTQNVAEWRTRTLSYEEAPVSQVVNDLNLYFERPVAVTDQALANRRVTLRLEVQDREHALSTLAGLLQARVEMEPGRDILAD